MDVSPEEGARLAVASWQERGWIDCARSIGPSRKSMVEVAVAQLLRTVHAEIRRRMIAKAPGLRLGNSPHVQLGMSRLRAAVIDGSAVNSIAILDSAARMISQLDARLRDALRSTTAR